MGQEIVIMEGAYNLYDLEEAMPWEKICGLKK